VWSSFCLISPFTLEKNQSTILLLPYLLWCQTRIVSILTSYRLDGPRLEPLEFQSQWGQRFLLFPNHPDWLGDPLSFLFTGYHYSFLEVKQPGLDVKFTTPSGAEFENDCSYISTPLWCGQGQPYLLLPFTSSVTILHICCVNCMLVLWSVC